MARFQVCGLIPVGFGEEASRNVERQRPREVPTEAALWPGRQSRWQSPMVTTLLQPNTPEKTGVHLPCQRVWTRTPACLVVLCYPPGGFGRHVRRELLYPPLRTGVVSSHCR